MTSASEPTAYAGPAFLVCNHAAVRRKFVGGRKLRRAAQPAFDAWIPVAKPIGLPEPVGVRAAAMRTIEEDEIGREVRMFEVRFEDERLEIALLYGLDAWSVRCRYVFLVEP